MSENLQVLDEKTNGLIVERHGCKYCGGDIPNFRSRRVFCSIECKGNWQREQKPYDRDWLYQKYVVEGLSAYQIAKIVDRDPKGVYNWLKGFGIPLRERSWSVEPDSQLFHDPDWLRREYIDNQRSTGEIAHEFGVTQENVIFFLKKAGIPRRSMSETRAIKHWGLAGETNGMYGRTGDKNPNWRGGVTPERQALYVSQAWAKAVRIVWKRDKGNCQRCQRHYTIVGEMHIHHIVSFVVEHLRTDPHNLVLLCYDCHNWVHSRQNMSKEFMKGENQ